jgi:hypothetical protein
MGLPADVVSEDRRLERNISADSELLAVLRWHWTLDESNSERVSIREYARSIGRDKKTVAAYAKGYLLMRGGEVAPSEAIERAKMGAESEAAVEAVAGARGVSFTHARQSRPTEIKRVRDIARERVEKYGGTIEEQADKAADWIVRSERAEQHSRDERRNRLGLRFVEMEGKLTKAKTALLDALSVAREVEWESEHRELLEHTLESVKSLIALVDLALTGAADVDWDAELAGLEEKAS